MTAVPELPEDAHVPDLPEESTETTPETSGGSGTPEVSELPETPRTPEAPVERVSDDEVFAQLVAGFDTPVDAESRSWPAAEDLSDLAPQPRPRKGIMSLPTIQAIPPVDPRTWTPEEAEDDEHFVPPPPPPVPRPEAPTRLAMAAVVGGVILVLVYAFGQLPGMAGFLGVCLFVGGVVTLVARMRQDEDEEDDDPHRGAVV